MASKDLTTGRARRAIKIGGLASHVGSNYLWTSLRRPFLDAGAHQRELLDTHIRNARLIVEESKQLRGAFLKLIQMLSMRGDILPQEALEVLSASQSGVPPMDYETIAEQLRKELGAPPEKLFGRFERQAFAAASLGQVHRARLPSGEEVAVKIQYPGVEQTVKEDLKNLKLLLATVGAIAKDIMRQKLDTQLIYRELEERLHEELDYEQEALNMRLFGRLLQDDPEVVIPCSVPALSSKRILTMSYLDGYRLADVLAPGVDPELKTWLARKYFTLLWRQILEFGVLHADPHPGNYLISYHPHLAILDFGSVRRFTPAVRKAHLAVARALLKDDREAIGKGMRDLGWLDADQDPEPMVRVLRILFEPVRIHGPYSPSDYDTVAKAAEVGELAVKHRLYKSPAHSVFLMRALIGMEAIVRQLNVKLDYRTLFSECVRRASKAAE